MHMTAATSPALRIRLFRAGRLLAIALLISAFAAFALPGQAHALTTEKCTARPNTDSGSTILGGKVTRITWEAQATIDALLKEGCDFAYIHVEAPDEMGHQGELDHKILAIEDLDKRIIAPVRRAMEEAHEDYRMLVLPDHPTPLRIRTHSPNPVPYVLYDSTRECKSCKRYTEEEAMATGHFEPQGHILMERFLSK